MERVGKAVLQYADNTLLDVLRLFELTVFSYLTGNNDMHLKNFSLIKASYGWTLAPSYDLLNVSIVNPQDQEELALTLAGKKKKISRKLLNDFGLGLGLANRQIESVFKRFQKSKKEAISLIKRSFLSEGMQKAYITVLENRYEILDE
jgi:serine/threonine-protein kinase HipA